MTEPAISTSEILAQYADGPAQLDSALAGLTASDLDLSADSWSIRQIVHHLLEHIPGACEKSVWLQRPGKEDIRITVFDVLELHVQHLADHIKDIQAIQRAHKV